MNEKYLLAELEDKIIDTVQGYIREHSLKDCSIVLSGGFDSGLLAALTGTKKAYRIKFPYGVKYDETRYAEAIAKHLGIDLIDYEITPEVFKQNLDEAIKVMGEPVTHFSLVPLYILMKELKNAGVKDVLSGEGPDEYLGGYARQIIFDEIYKLWSIPELRNYHKLIRKTLDYAEAEPFSNEYILCEMYASLVGYDILQFQDWGKKVDGKYPLQGLIGKMDMELGKIEYMEQRFANHFGINFHYPYINSELAEYCYRLPDNLKIRDGVTKWGFRQICKKYLPEFIMDRSKMGGPVFPVNKVMGWDTIDEFSKSEWIRYQEGVLNGNK